jgi:hypothetical protein
VVATTNGKTRTRNDIGGSKRRRRGEVAFYCAYPFGYLVQRFIRAKSVRVKDRLAFELMPYVRPKLRTVDGHRRPAPGPARCRRGARRDGGSVNALRGTLVRPVRGIGPSYGHGDSGALAGPLGSNSG